MRSDDGKSSIDHRRDRTGWFLPRRVSAEEGLRSARHGAPHFEFRHRTNRSSAQGLRSRFRRSATALRRPRRRHRASANHRAGASRRGLQSRRAIARAHLVRSTRIHRRRGRPGRAATARGAARSQQASRAGGAAVPGGIVGDVRQGGGESAARDHAVSSAQSLRMRQGLRALADRQLSRGLRAVRVQRDPVQPRVAAARREFRHAQDHAQRHANQSWASRRSSRSETWTRAATGDSPATTSRRCG